MLSRLAHALNIRDGEGRIVALLLAHSAFLGLTTIFMGTAANALFIDAYGAASLPYIYIAVAIVVSGIGYTYTRLEARLPFNVLLLGNLTTLLLGVLLLRGALFTDAAFPIIILRVWSDVIWILTSLEFWGLASRLFDLRQSKRLFGLIGSGDIAAKILGGFSVSGVVVLLGTDNLLLVSAFGLAASIGLLFVITRIHANKLGKLEQSQTSASQRKDTQGQQSVFRSRYAILIFSLSALSYLVLYFVDTAFFSEAQVQFPDASKLAAFIGGFFAVANIVTLISRLFLSAPLINRYGLLIGLLSLPLLILVGAIAVATLGTLGAAVVVIFWLTAVTKLVDLSIRYSIYRSASLILYQPLSSNQRGQMQTTVESIIEPVASGVAGIALVLLLNGLSFGTTELFYFALVMLAVWIFVVTVLNREYTSVMVHALQKHRLEGNFAEIVDANSTNVLKQGVLNAKKPGEAIYAFNLLREIGCDTLTQFSVELFEHPMPEVQIEALRYLDETHPLEVLDDVRQKLRTETRPDIKAMALQAFAAYGTEDVIEEIEPYLTDPDLKVEEAALVGLLHSGGIEGIMMAGQRLFTLLDAEKVEERVLAANVIGNADIDGLYRPLRQLINDDNHDVTKAAIQASGKLKSPRLWKLVVPYLETFEFAGLATHALALGGEEVIPTLEETWNIYSDNDQVLTHITRIASRVKGDKVISFLHQHLFDSREVMRLPILNALTVSKFQADETDFEALEKMYLAEIKDAAWSLNAIHDLEQGGNAVRLLREALQIEIVRNEYRAFLLLSFMYDRETMLNVKDTFVSPRIGNEKKAYALEILDTVLPKHISRLLISILDDSVSADQQLQQLRHTYSLTSETFRDRLIEIINADDTAVTPWSRSCAIYAVSELKDKYLLQYLAQYLGSKSPIVCETALLTIHRIAADETSDILESQGDTSTHVLDLYQKIINEKDKMMLSTIEKVFALKSVDIFGDTPEESLIAIATIIEEEVIHAETKLFDKGDVGRCMYIVYSGAIRIHDGEKVLAERKDGEVFGEMSLLDTETRSASATAAEETHVLRLDQDPFFEILAESHEVSRGIIQMLTQRLRQTSNQLSAAGK